MISVSRPNRRGAPAACSALLACGLTGCVSTQQKASWLQIEDARIIAAQSPTVVRTENPGVQIDRVAVLHHGKDAVFVVRLRNLAGRTLSDLPISVGFLRHGKRLYLNRRSDLAYSDAHVSAVDAHQVVTWVFSDRMKRLPRGRAFALVGPRPVPALALGHAAPSLLVRLTEARSGQLRVRVTNASSIPQPQLPVYAVSATGGRVTAAGQATITNLAAGQTAQVQVGLIGRAHSNLQLEAMPTMFLP